MPHLSQLQREYQDQNVTIIGLSTPDKHNTLEAVRKMVAAKGEGMDYTVAFDGERKSSTAWMQAAGQRGIPASFLVDQSGKIAWIGHPGSLDVPLAAVVAGTWDYVEGPAMLKRAEKAKRQVYGTARKDPGRALELLHQFEADYPLFTKNLDSLRFDILARLPEHKAEAETVGTRLVETAIAAKNSSALNALAWDLVDPLVEREQRFLPLALRAAEAANELTGNKDGAILDTLARVQFWRGKLPLAVKIQERAIANAEGPLKADLEKSLEEYKERLAKGCGKKKGARG